jgi:hypothetical protein
MSDSSILWDGCQTGLSCEMDNRLVYPVRWISDWGSLWERYQNFPFIYLQFLPNLHHLKATFVWWYKSPRLHCYIRTGIDAIKGWIKQLDMASILCPGRFLQSDLPVQSIVSCDLQVASHTGKILCWRSCWTGRPVDAFLEKNSSVEMVQVPGLPV